MCSLFQENKHPEVQSQLLSEDNVVCLTHPGLQHRQKPDHSQQTPQPGGGRAFQWKQELLADQITTEDGVAKGLPKMSPGGKITMEP